MRQAGRTGSPLVLFSLLNSQLVELREICGEECSNSVKTRTVVTC